MPSHFTEVPLESGGSLTIAIETDNILEALANRHDRDLIIACLDLVATHDADTDLGGGADGPVLARLAAQANAGPTGLVSSFDFELSPCAQMALRSIAEYPGRSRAFHANELDHLWNGSEVSDAFTDLNNRELVTAGHHDAVTGALTWKATERGLGYLAEVVGGRIQGHYSDDAGRAS